MLLVFGLKSTIFIISSIFLLLVAKAQAGEKEPLSRQPEETACISTDENIQFPFTPCLSWDEALKLSIYPSIVREDSVRLPFFSNQLLMNTLQISPENGTGPPFTLLPRYENTPSNAFDEMTMKVMMTPPVIPWIIPQPKAAALAPKVAAEPPPAPEKPPLRPNRYFLPKRFWASQTEGTLNRTADCSLGTRRITNYTTAALLLAPDYENGHLLPMIDVRGNYLSTNQYAVSAGVVGRFIPKSFCALVGLNVYYDFRRGHKGNFHQAGVGMEVLGSRWDFRANSYFPVASQKHHSKCVFDDYIGDYFAINRKWEFGSYGGNAEIGCLAVKSRDFLLYIATGPYYFAGNFKQSIAGGEVRVRPQYRDYVALEFRVNYDSVFKTSFDGTIFVYVPLYEFYSYLKNKKGPCGITSRQVYQQVERFGIMQLRKQNCWETNF